MRLILLFSVLFYLFLLSSCKKYEAATPSFFIQSKAVSIVPQSNKEGSASHNITDLWFYVNGQYQGTYPLGSLIPVNANGKPVKINVFAGIKNNGIADTRIFYPFYDFIALDTLVESGKTIERSFSFKYRTATTFTWTENFDQPVGRSVNSSGYEEVLDTVSGNNAFENLSLRVSLPPSGSVAKIESSGDGFTLPQQSSNVYLELDYKCNVPFTVGLMDSDGKESAAIVVNKQENWNKIYVQLATSVNSLISNRYKVYFRFIRENGSTDTKEVYLDNIKLLYF